MNIKRCIPILKMTQFIVFCHIFVFYILKPHRMDVQQHYILTQQHKTLYP
jgi:hypothetical protein